MKNKSIAAAVLALGLTLGVAGGAVAASPVTSHTSVTASATATASGSAAAGATVGKERVQEIHHATDNHDGVKGFVWNKMSRGVDVFVGSKYNESGERFHLGAGECFTYACGENVDIQFLHIQSGNVCVGARDDGSVFTVWDSELREDRYMEEGASIEYAEEGCKVHLNRPADGNRGIYGENSRWTGDWANLDVTLTDKAHRTTS